MNTVIDLHKMIVGIVMVVVIIFTGGQVHANSNEISFRIGYAKFAKGNCTEYVAKKRPDLFPSYHGRDRAFGGDAGQRLYNARHVGLPTGRDAQPGAIAVFAPGRGATGYGHVAFVEEVYNDGTILVSDMNYNGINNVTYRIISAGLAVGYIYDTTPPPIIDDQPHVPYIVDITRDEETYADIAGDLHDDGSIVDTEMATLSLYRPGQMPSSDTNVIIGQHIADRRYSAHMHNSQQTVGSSTIHTSLSNTEQKTELNGNIVLGQNNTDTGYIAYLIRPI